MPTSLVEMWLLYFFTSLITWRPPGILSDLLESTHYRLKLVSCGMSGVLRDLFEATHYRRQQAT